MKLASSQAPGHVFDIRVQAAIFVHHQHRRQFVGIGGPDQIALDGAVALRGGDGDEPGGDAAVVGWNLDRPGVIGPQHLEQRRRADAEGGELLGAIEKPAAAHSAVHIDVKQVQKLLGKVRRLFSLHGIPPEPSPRRFRSRPECDRRMPRLCRGRGKNGKNPWRRCGGADRSWPMRRSESRRCYHGAASGEAADRTRAHGRRRRRNWTFEIPALRHAAPRLPGRVAARWFCRRRRLSRPSR